MESGLYLLEIASGDQAAVTGIDPNLITAVFWHEEAEQFFVSTMRDVFTQLTPMAR